MHTGEPSCAAARWPAIAAGLQRARIRAHAGAWQRGNTTQAAAHAGRGACGRRAGIASGPAHAFSADGKPVPVVDTARKFDPHEAARMWHRRCGNAGAATQVVAHARQGGCGRIRRDGRTGPSVTNPQDRRRRTSQSRAPKSDGEAEKPRRACRTRHEAKQNQQGPTPGSRKNRQATEQGALEDTAEETSSAHVRRHGERPAPRRKNAARRKQTKASTRSRKIDGDQHTPSR